MTEKYLINTEETLIIITDIQEKLIRAMDEDVVKEVIKNNLILIETAKLFNIPIILTEQYPKGLGKTVEEIKKTLPLYEPIEKITFNSFLEPNFEKKLNEYKDRKKVILTGMETHVCLWQTAIDLIKRDYAVFVPKDAVCSRRKLDWETGLDLIKSAGGIVTTTETLVFQILKRAGTPEFKKILELVK
uniref:Isochorismatase family protein n=1 Tax=Thermodesulfobacterium geofontis TaxID=1295609 RepID=A0A7V4N429_9BACT